MIAMLWSPTQGGLYIFQIYDYYACSGMTLLLFATLQSLCIGWIYGEFIHKKRIYGSFTGNLKFPDLCVFVDRC